MVPVLFLVGLAALGDAADLRLSVDAKELQRGLLLASVRLAATPGQLALVFPKWIPGTHAPGGRVDNLGGLKFTDGKGTTLSWVRDESDPFRFVVTVPDGADAVQADIVYVANRTNSNSTSSDVIATPGLSLINWNACVLYPDRAVAAALSVDCTLTAPQDWRIGSALEVAEATSGSWHFAECSLRDLIDRPLIGGPTVGSRQLTVDGAPVWMHFGSANLKNIAVDDAWAEYLQNCVGECLALFGRAHYSSYHFLMLEGDRFQGIGLEHASSTVCGMTEGALRSYDEAEPHDRSVLIHEFVHSWCGKHVRPAGMDASDYQQPLRTGLLWVYEGLTQYLGEIIAMRAGGEDVDERLDDWAGDIASLRRQGGRAWRSLEDTASSGWLARGRGGPWPGLRRGQDYYQEGALFWLRADLIIRNQSAGKRSLDDFCSAFFGPAVPAGGCRTYQLEDVIAALERCCAYPWQNLIHRLIQQPYPEFETTFLADAGYAFAYSDVESEILAKRADKRKMIDCSASIGCTFRAGYVSDVIPESPADQAGMHEGDWIRLVYGFDFSRSTLHEALVMAKSSGSIVLTGWDGKAAKYFTVACKTGPMHPHLERIADHADRLQEVFSSRCQVAESAVP